MYKFIREMHLDKKKNKVIINPTITLSFQQTKTTNNKEKKPKPNDKPITF